MHWQRTFLHPMLTTFDAGGRDECIIKRELSNSPLQALTLLNDPTQVEAARALAEILMAEKNDNARIETAYQRALARKPTAKERRTLKAFLQRERKRFSNESNQADPFLEVGLEGDDAQVLLREPQARQLCRPGGVEVEPGHERLGHRLVAPPAHGG